MAHWEQRLAEAGCRITASRRAVMQVLEEAGVALTPQEILERALPIHPELGLVTVYRTVKLFEELQLAYRVHRSDGCHGYVLASPGHRHHVVCQGCGRAAEFPGSEDLNALIVQVERCTRYRVDSHLLQLFGLCPTCQEMEL